VQSLHGRNDVIGVHRRFDATLPNRFLHDLHRVFGQQLQDPHVLPCPGHKPVALFEVRP
jgi:hypothetical protein